MPIKLGTTSIGAIYKGTTKISRVYKGDTIVYQEGSKLPPEFIELEYIESTGTQYIDTQLTSSTTQLIKIKFASSISIPSVESYIFGYWGIIPATNNIRCGFYRGNIYLNGRFTYQYSGALQIGTIIEATSSDLTGINTNYKEYLFAQFDSNSNLANCFIQAKLYSCKIYDNNVLVRNFIPAYRRVDCVVGLYDLVNGVFYTNAGTGEFKRGAMILEDYQEVEYIESTGTQYIDSLVIGNNDSGIKLNFAFTNISENYEYVAGGLVAGSYRFTPLFLDKSNSGKFLYCDTITFSASNKYGVADTNKHSISFNYPNRNIIYDNNLIKQTADNFANTDGNSIYLFARNYQSSILNAYIKLYYCKLYDNDILVRDFVPVYRKADTVIGLLDTKNMIFYTNAGTGTFLKGNDLWLRFITKN